MQSSKDSHCNHISLLSKDTLKKLTQTPLNQNCHLHQTHPIYYLCLHCATSCCLDYVQDITCLKNHFKQESKHYFALEMELGTIWCNGCNDYIQNKIFMGNEKEESCQKMKRFAKFVEDIWKQLTGKLNINKTIASHRGLKNLGNTCFLNAVLQCLYASASLRELYKSYKESNGQLKHSQRCIDKEVQYFYDDMIERKENQRWNIVSTKKPKAREESQRNFRKQIKNADFNLLIKKFFEEMSQQSSDSYNPSSILDFLAFIDKKYNLNQQQDAEQLLLLAIDLLSQGEKISFISDRQRYNEVQKILGFQKLTHIQQIFGFYLLNEVQCNNCKEITHSINLSYNVGISLDSSGQEEYQFGHMDTKIEIDYWQELHYPQSQGKCELLDTFFKIQRLNLSNNYYSCEKCKSLVAYRKHYIISQPKVLVVSVKRFNSKLQKNTKKVPIQSQIKISHFCASQGQTHYNLIGVVVHEGHTLNTGHYICFIKINNNWLLCSDHRVQVVDWKYVQEQEAYILFYQQQNESDK